MVLRGAQLIFCAPNPLNFLNLLNPKICYNMRVMGIVKKVVFIGMGLLLTGCFSLETATLTKCGEENILVTNYGWYLFNLLPVATGNAAEGAVAPTVFFRNDVTMDKVQRRAQRYADSKGKKLDNLAYHNHSSVMFNIPGTDFPIPIPYVLTFREIQLSGMIRND